MSTLDKPVIVAFTGASGAVYGLRLLEQLLVSDIPVRLVLSKPARVVFKMETNLSLPRRPLDVASFLTSQFSVSSSLLKVYGEDEWTAPLASGSGLSRGMIVCPCTTATLSSIAHGSSRSLLERSADVVLKERRKLILVVRETPLSEIHLENMLKISKLGGIILPASPGFYHKPTKIVDLVDFIVARVLDHLEIPHTLIPRWGDE